MKHLSVWIRNQLNYIDYKYLQGSNDTWSCISCCNEMFIFGRLRNEIFLRVVDCNNAQNTVQNSDTNNINRNIPLALKTSSNLFLLFNQFNNFSPKQNMTLKTLRTLTVITLINFKLKNLMGKVRHFPYFLGKVSHFPYFI